MLDGLFQQALLAYVSGRPEVLDALVGQVRTMMPLMLTPPVATTSGVTIQGSGVAD